MSVDGKSNEIPAAPELLKLIELAGATVTMDAMQGQRVLLLGSQHGFEQEGIAPGAAAAFHDGADFGGMLLQEGQAEAIKPREILSQLGVRDARFVFAKGVVEGPVAGIFDGPMLAYGVRETFHAHRQAADIIASRDGLFSILNVSANGDSDRL